MERSGLSPKPHHSHLSMDWGISIQSYAVSLLLISMFFTEKTGSWHPGDSYAYSQQSRLGENDLRSTEKLIGCIGPIPFLPCPHWGSFYRAVPTSPRRAGFLCCWGLVWLAEGEEDSVRVGRCCPRRNMQLLRKVGAHSLLALTPIHRMDLWGQDILFIKDW